MALKNKEKSVTLIDLAKILNLTPRAVSKALNGEDSTVRVSDATRKRVQALAKRLNYRPNRMAQTLRTGKSGMVGVLVFQAFGHIFQLKLYLARHYAEKHGFHPNIYVIPDGSTKSRDRAVDVMIDSKVDAVIIFNDFGDTHIERLMSAGIPVTVVGATSHTNSATYFADLTDGFAMVAQHVIAQGSTSISLLSIIEDQQTGVPWHIQCAKDGIEAAVKEARLAGREVSASSHIEKVTFDGFMLKDIPKIHGLHAGGYLGMKHLIQSGQLPDAVICNGDQLAQGALLACAESGVRIPQDMLLAGFGDDPSSSAGPLPITSVRPPLDDLCRLAFDDLKAMTESGEILKDRKVVLPYELIVRQSTQRPTEA